LQDTQSKFSMKEERLIGLKSFGEVLDAFPTFGMKTTFDTLQELGM